MFVGIVWAVFQIGDRGARHAGEVLPEHTARVPIHWGGSSVTKAITRVAWPIIIRHGQRHIVISALREGFHRSRQAARGTIAEIP